MTRRASNIAIKENVADEPLEGVRWDAAWETEAASELFTAVRELCGARVGPPELTDHMVAEALAEAREILEQLDQEPELEEAVAADSESAEPMDNDSTFATACRNADAKRARLDESEEILRARRLLDDGISLERADAEINSDRLRGRAANATVEALMYSLRERGVRALDEPDTRRRLSELSDDQLLGVAGRLQRLTPEIARAWSVEEIENLIKFRETLR